MRETVFVRLVIETAKLLEMKKISFGEQDAGRQKLHRGIVRGMALVITKQWGNGYEPHWTEEVKACERRAIRLAKEWNDDGEPRGDGWWLRRRGQFWRSSSDAAQV